MTAQAPHVLTPEEVGKRLDEGGFAEATQHLRKWINGGSVDASLVYAEMAFWLDYLGGSR